MGLSCRILFLSLFLGVWTLNVRFGDDCSVASVLMRSSGGGYLS